VNDGRPGLVVLLLADPHLLECGQRREDRSADPHGILALRRSDDFDLHGGGREGGDLLLHAVSDAGEHRGSTRQNRVGVKIFTNINVALHDAVVSRLVNTARLHAEEARLEHRLRASESFVADGDHLPVRQLVALLQ